MSIVYSGQGKAFIADRLANGNPGPFRDLGNIDEKGVTIELTTEMFSVMETSSGQRGLFARLPQSKQGVVNFSLNEWIAKNIALQLLGVDTTISGSTVSAETLPTVAVGDFYVTAQADISSLVLTDSAGSPVTLTANTHYRIVDAKFGRIEFLNLGSFTQPFKAAYTYAAALSVPMLTENPPEKWLRFELLNTAYQNQKVIVDLYRVQFDPVKTLNLLQAQGIHVADFSPGILLDFTKEANTTLGQFGRVRQLSV